MKAMLLVGLGGAAGSIVRYLLQRRFNDTLMPYGTLSVNFIGCFLIGILAGLLIRHHTSQTLVLLLMTGFCGGFTTLSAFSLESLHLLQQNRIAIFFLYAASTIILGLAATFIGYKISS